MQALTNATNTIQVAPVASPLKKADVAPSPAKKARSAPVAEKQTLESAIEKNDFDAIVQLFHNKDVTEQDKEAILDFATEDGKEALMEKLIQSGVDLIEFEELIFSSNPRQVRILVQNGVDINISDEMECSPLWRACESGDEDMVKLLLELGADPNICDYYGQSPLYETCFKMNSEPSKKNIFARIAVLLVQNGAEIDSKAVKIASPQLIEMLEQVAVVFQDRTMEDVRASRDGSLPEEDSTIQDAEDLDNEDALKDEPSDMEEAEEEDDGFIVPDDFVETMDDQQ
eukprot:GEZU01042487.1.p1 GENE.GEZU01042487.1~~GEZU01042487.1.p1  ORF type:complete len:298 (+),score=128.60 GEZU01042487.1:39-896(+)